MNFAQKIGRFFRNLYRLSEYSSDFARLLGGRPSATGLDVSERGALSSTAVWAAVRVLSTIIASLPLPVYKKLAPRGKARDPDHPLYQVCHDIANPEMTAFAYRCAMIVHLLLWGNHYANIESNVAGQTIALWPLHPGKTIPVRDTKTGQLWYVTTLPNGEQRKLRFDEVLHIQGLSEEGILGINPIRTMSEAIGLAQAMEYFAAKFFGSGAKLGGVLEHPGKMTKEAHDRLRASMEQMHSGLDNAHRMAILEEGMKFHETTANPEESQLLGGRKFQISEVSRITGVPMHLLAELDRATFSNIEHQSLELVIYCVRPWCVNIEQAINMRCLTEKERKKWSVEHVLEGLLRGDIKSRYEAYKIAVQNGWLNANEIREKENENPYDGGDVYYAPQNCIPADMVRDYFINQKAGDKGGNQTGNPNNEDGGAGN